MSDATNISLRKFTVEDFLSFDHGTDVVAMSVWRGRIEHGLASVVELTPDQADEVAEELRRRAQLVREESRQWERRRIVKQG